MKIDTVLFDLDGTLMDTSSGIIKSVRYVLEKMGLSSVSEQQLYSFIGPTVKERLIEIFPLSDKDANMAMKIFRENYGQNNLYMAHAYKGIKELLLSLKMQNYKLGVATYKRTDQAKLLLREKQLYDCFDIICGSDSNATLRKSDIIEKACLEIKADKKNTVMVGDSKSDAIGAMEVGVQFIGVTYGFGFKEIDEVRQYVHIGIASEIKMIQSIIMNINY